MEICEKRHDKIVVLHLSGTVSGIESVRLCRRLESYTKDEYNHVVINLKNVDFINSTAIGGFIYLSKAMQKSGVGFVLCAPNVHIRQLFRDCSLEDVLKIDDNNSLDDLASLRKE